MSDFNWNCPYCQRDVTISDERYSLDQHINTISNASGQHTIVTKFIVCPNQECKKYTLTAELVKGNLNYNQGSLKKWNLIPSSNAKAFPDYIPKQILNDYDEACQIKDLSPKASATLARRCLQGMIRDFHNVKKGRLVDEIEAIQDIIDPITWEAIDSVRKIGNIGAHMEKDIDLIIDVEPNEAELLINLIEILFQDWYISKNEKQKRLEKISLLSKQKDIDRKQNKPS
jgi:hypothetical protein